MADFRKIIAAAGTFLLIYSGLNYDESIAPAVLFLLIAAWLPRKG